MSVLLDSNIMIALVLDDHLHHAAAEAWFDGVEQFATCPITQGALFRTVVRRGGAPTEARAFLVELCAADVHEFWPDDVPCADVRLTGVIGHRQVTDAYLAGSRERAGAGSRPSIVDWPPCTPTSRSWCRPGRDHALG